MENDNLYLTKKKVIIFIRQTLYFIFSQINQTIGMLHTPTKS